MVRKHVTHVAAVLVSLALVIASSQNQSVALAAEAATPTQAAPMSQSELRGLVAPIALYPDNLVAEVLAAATFPDQVAIANYWLQQNKNLTGNALMQAVDKQTWDASVKALTQFPSVLGNMQPTNAPTRLPNDSSPDRFCVSRAGDHTMGRRRPTCRYFFSGSRMTTAPRMFHDGPMSGCVGNQAKPS